MRWELFCLEHVAFEAQQTGSKFWEVIFFKEIFAMKLDLILSTRLFSSFIKFFDFCFSTFSNPTVFYSSSTLSSKKKNRRLQKKMSASVSHTAPANTASKTTTDSHAKPVVAHDDHHRQQQKPTAATTVQANVVAPHTDEKKPAPVHSNAAVPLKDEKKDEHKPAVAQANSAPRKDEKKDANVNVKTDKK
jgi:hypothetical protein